MNESTQPDLISQDSPKVTPEDVDRLIELLRGRDWVTSRELIQLAVNDDLKWSERKIRAIASASAGRVVSYPGSPGYKLTLECTPEEISGTGILRHQANEMIRRAVEIDRVWHGRKKV